MVTPKQSVFLFIGDDKYLAEKALDDLKTSLPGKPLSPSDQATFYGSELVPQDVFDQLNTVPLLSDKRLIVIKEIDKVEDEFRSSLINYIKKPSKSAYLVMDAQDDSVLEDYAEVIKEINVRKLDAPVGGLFASWVKNYVSSSGKTIEDNAVLILKELEGKDLSCISQELDKLVTFTGDRREISAEDVESLVGRSMVISVFEIADAIGRNDTAGAIRIASDLIAGGKKEHEIIGILCWHLKRMLKARILKLRGESDYTIASIVRVGRRFQTKFFNQLNMLDPKKLRSDIEILLQADLDIKRSKFDPGAVLEFAIIRLCLL